MKEASPLECHECGFEVWNPVNLDLRVSRADLYSDIRFPGRLILILNEHYDHLHEVPDGLMTAFMQDIKDVHAALMGLDNVRRVNMAILGNTVAHVHAHIIPRYPGEPLPGSSPWDDPRPREHLPEGDMKVVVQRIEDVFVRQTA